MANIGGQEKPNNQQEQSENTTKAKVISKHEMENIKQKTLGTKPRIMTRIQFRVVGRMKAYPSFHRGRGRYTLDRFPIVCMVK